MRNAISAADISESVGVNESTIWRWVSEGKLPQPFKPTKRCTRWWADEVEAALEAKRTT